MLVKANDRDGSREEAASLRSSLLGLSWCSFCEEVAARPAGKILRGKQQWGWG